MNKVLIILAILAVNLIACNSNENKAQAVSEQKPASANANVYKMYRVIPNPDKTKAVDFEFKVGEDVKTFSEMTKGKVTFINFWGTWCPPCRAEIPDIIKLQNKYKDNLVVVGLTLERDKDPNNALKKVADYSSKNGINYMNIITIPDIVEAYGGINAVPTTFVINKEGVIVETIVGGETFDKFEAIVKKYL